MKINSLSSRLCHPLVIQPFFLDWGVSFLGSLQWERRWMTGIERRDTKFSSTKRTELFLFQEDKCLWREALLPESREQEESSNRTRTLVCCMLWAQSLLQEFEKELEVLSAKRLSLVKCLQMNHRVCLSSVWLQNISCERTTASWLPAHYHRHLSSW